MFAQKREQEYVASSKQIRNVRTNFAQFLMVQNEYQGKFIQNTARCSNEIRVDVSSFYARSVVKLGSMKKTARKRGDR